MTKSFGSRIASFSVALMALSAVLFLTAFSIRDFGQGQGNLFSGLSSLLLLVSFTLLAALALALSVFAFRAANRLASEPKSAATSRERPVSRPDESGAAGRASVIVHEKNEAGAKPDTSSQLLSDTAGELRSSVIVLQEELEGMIDEEIPADKEHIESLYDETDRLRKIIDGMEQLSQAQALARSLRKVPVEVAPLLNAIIEKTRASAGEKSISFELRCEAGISMNTDPDCLNKIIGNLADNAAKAVKDSGTVTIGASRADGEVVFSVKDTGTGIKRSHADHLFERFFRGAGSGVGMGLAIVKELVDACGGKIEVQTAWGKGSVFTVHIPSA